MLPDLDGGNGLLESVRALGEPLNKAAAGATRRDRRRHPQMNVRGAAPLKLQFPDVAWRLAVLGLERLADIFGTYNKPPGRGRVDVGCLGRRTADG